MAKKTTRREAFKNLVLAGTGVMATSSISCEAAQNNKKTKTLKGNINHSVCRWTYKFLSVDELCKHVKEIGFAAIDLVGPKDWDTLKSYGVFSSNIIQH
jgi:hydroxypyruvate isomerase